MKVRIGEGTTLYTLYNKIVYNSVKLMATFMTGINLNTRIVHMNNVQLGYRHDVNNMMTIRMLVNGYRNYRP